MPTNFCIISYILNIKCFFKCCTFFPQCFMVTLNDFAMQRFYGQGFMQNKKFSQLQILLVGTWMLTYIHTSQLECAL